MVGVLKQMGIDAEPVSIQPFHNQEDGSAYNVWRVDFPQKTFVMKQAKGEEMSIYKTYFGKSPAYAPTLHGTTQYNERDYILMDYIAGEDLVVCDRQKLISALDSLIAMQGDFWDSKRPENALNSRINRYKYLCDPLLEAVYKEYLADCEQIPATLCHDDLLPFNVIVSNDRCVFIDWEVGGILPYPASLARLIAHTEDREGAFFYMSDADKAFAIDYYYEKLPASRGVAYENYLRSLNLSLFYEYCEWVFVGNKYDARDTERYKHYYQLASRKAEELRLE